MSDETGREIAALRARIVELEEQLAGPDVIEPEAKPAPRPKSNLRTVRIIHRYAALLTCGFMLLMGVSGIVLGHADSLGLQPIMVQLHAGLFIGPMAWLYCDVIGLALSALAITGMTMYLAPRPRARP